MGKTDNRPGKINLVGLFEAAAQRLQLAVDQGRLLHATKNIRDAGLPLEVEFRAFLRARLPAPFEVTAGYLFDPLTKCTPQIDAMIIDGRESHELMRSDDGAAYVPYPSGRCLFEIKNSVKGLGKHVAQIGSIADAVNKMRIDAASLRHSSGPYVEDPLTVLLIGESKNAKLSDFKKAFGRLARAPDYTLLLDRGTLIARWFDFDQIAIPEDNAEAQKPTLDFYAYRQIGKWGVWKPDLVEHRRGRALLWLYYALVAQLNFASRGNQGSILDFTNQIQRDFPMTLHSPLETATTW